MSAQRALWSASRAPRGRVRRCADVSLGAMRAAGRLERVDEALVAAQRVAADNLDRAERSGASPYVVAAALRVYLEAVAALYVRVGIVAPDDDDPIWRALSAELGDPEAPGPPDVG